MLSKALLYVCESVLGDDAHRISRYTTLLSQVAKHCIAGDSEGGSLCVIDLFIHYKHESVSTNKTNHITNQLNALI